LIRSQSQVMTLASPWRMADWRFSSSTVPDFKTLGMCAPISTTLRGFTIDFPSRAHPVT
jgi:hypothetical protein